MSILVNLNSATQTSEAQTSEAQTSEAQPSAAQTSQALTSKTEDEKHRTVLFPVRLDDAVMKIKTGWPADVRRTRHVAEFTRWRDHNSYQKAFGRLLRDLKAEARQAGEG